MIYQVIQAGWVYEIEAPGGCQVEDRAGDEPCLRVGSEAGSEPDSLLTPRAMVRAAKDHLHGLNCTRAWRIDVDHEEPAPAPAIVEVG